MKTALLLALAVLGACSGELGPIGDDDCSLTLSFTPTMPVAGPTNVVRVNSAASNVIGTSVYNWTVSRGGSDVPFTYAQTNRSAIEFTATDAGIYEVSAQLTPSSNGSCTDSANINVLADTTFENARLHIVPPPSAMGPIVDRPIQIHDGSDFALGPVVLELSTLATGTVRNASGVGIPAYLVLSPQGMGGAMVETFASGTGAFSARLLLQPHDVLVIPSATNIAPQRLTNYTPGGTLPMLTAPDTITGTVHQGATPIANARVQVTIDGVPTTIGVTAANGSYSVLGHHQAGASVTVAVTPPATSGLPRLEVTGGITTTSAIDVAYSAALVPRNLGGVPVRRGGAALANRAVVLVGNVAGAGTIAGLTATGYLRVPTTTDAGGNLPSVLAPAVALSAVTTVGPGDLAVGSIPATAPAAIDAPAMTAIVTTAGGGSAALSGATLDLVPKGALAAANAPALHFTADETGRVTGSIPTGGTYDVRWSDPLGRVGPLVAYDRASIAAAYTLPPAVYISGDVTITGNANPVVGASVQILCDGCTGLDRNRPIAEAATDAHGSFRIAVPDPAAM